MSVEDSIFSALKTLVADRVYRDITPSGVVALPRITFQQVGGLAQNFVENAVVGKKNGNFQMNVWGATRLQVAGLSRQVEDALKTSAVLNTTILAAPVAVYEPDTELYGTHQDFSFWF